MDAVIAVRRQERESIREKEKLKNRLHRMVRDDEGFSEDEIPRKNHYFRKIPDMILWILENQ